MRLMEFSSIRVRHIMENNVGYDFLIIILSMLDFFEFVEYLPAIRKLTLQAHSVLDGAPVWRSTDNQAATGALV